MVFVTRLPTTLAPRSSVTLGPIALPSATTSASTSTGSASEQSLSRAADDTAAPPASSRYRLVPSSPSGLPQSCHESTGAVRMRAPRSTMYWKASVR